MYRTLLADPPWAERGGGRSKRGADRHYPLMNADDIARTIETAPVWNPAADAHFYLWATDNHLPDAIWVMRQVGFKYIRTLPWIKLVNRAFGSEELPPVLSDPAEYLNSLLKIGLGQYFRGASELLLFGVHGDGFKACTEDNSLCNVIFAPRGEHSRKPDEVYERIEARSLPPRVELFARPPARPGWTVWGNECQTSGS